VHVALLELLCVSTCEQRETCEKYETTHETLPLSPYGYSKSY